MPDSLFQKGNACENHRGDEVFRTTYALQASYSCVMAFVECMQKNAQTNKMLKTVHVLTTTYKL
jgi:hypothetical protein